MFAIPSRQMSEPTGCVVMIGVGFTITVKTSTGSPRQPFKSGVTVNTTLPGVFPLLIMVRLGITCDVPLDMKPVIFGLFGTVVAAQIKLLLVLLATKEIGVEL